MNGKLILVVGPSGSGKNTLINHVLKIHPEFKFVVSATTRNKRQGEIEGVTRYFFTKEEFEKKIENNEFIEWAEYGGNLYGTPKSEVIKPLEGGKLLINEIEVQGARIIKNLLPKENLFIIFTKAGTWDELVKRILERGPMSDDELSKRHSRFSDEMTFEKEADYVILNEYGKVEEAKKKMEKIVNEILEK